MENPSERNLQSIMGMSRITEAIEAHTGAPAMIYIKLLPVL